MIKTVEVQVVCRVTLEIDTDKVSYGVHGGCEDPDEIIQMAVKHYGWNAEIESADMTEEGIKVIKSYVDSVEQ